MMYKVATPDGRKSCCIDTLAPGTAAKKAVEEGWLKVGRLVVFDETGKWTVWDVGETRIVYAYEVRNG